MKSGPCVEVSKVQYYLTIIVLISALVSSVVSLGYTIRRIDEMEVRVTNLEQHGSVPAQLTYKDVQWIIDSMKVMETKMDRIESKLDRHILREK